MLIKLGKMSGELYFYKTPIDKVILDSSSQLFWKLKDSSKSLDNLNEGRYSLQAFYQKTQELNYTDSAILEKSLKRLNSIGFFQEEKIENKLEDEFDIHQIVINPTTKCNLDCWYCYSNKQRQYISKELTMEEIKKTIIYFVERKEESQSKIPLSISLFYTSEITLDFHIFKEIKKFAEEIRADYNFNIFLFPPPTNLFKIDHEFVDFIEDYGYLTVSINYNNQEQIQRIKENLTQFDNEIIKHCIIPLHSGMKNLFDIYTDFMGFFDYVSLRPVRIGDNTKFPWTSDLIIDFENELIALTRRILELEEEKLVKFLLSLGSSDYFSRYFQRVISRSKLLNRCPAGIASLAVGSDAKFYPCSGFIGEGNYVLGSIENGINEDSMRIYQEKISSNKICRECSIRYYCGGFCQDWKQMNKSRNDDSQIECKINHTYFKNCLSLVLGLLEQKASVLSKYTKEKGIDFRLSYPLNFDEFVSFFS